MLFADPTASGDELTRIVVQLAHDGCGTHTRVRNLGPGERGGDGLSMGIVPNSRQP